MTATRPTLRVLVILIALFPSFATEFLPAQVPGVSREQMWPAPTAEDWKKPCLITWQRTWDDAVALSKETGRPILVCVSMDGEIASEHYAGIRYRQPDIAKLYQPYVTVIASTYRHTPRDHDEKGHRIPCPRFGGVTCGEHISIEPLLFEKFMEGRRVAPRHIMVSLDGKETYDVFYAFDTASVFKTIEDGFLTYDKKLLKPPRGDRSIIERVISTDSRDRNAVEKAFRAGDEATRRALLEAAIAQGAKVPIELLRLALYGFDVQLSQQAREALAKAGTTGSVDLISDTLGGPLDEKDRKALVDALARLGGKSDKARRLSVVHRGLDAKSQSVDMGSWSKALQGGATYSSSLDLAAVAAQLEKHDEVLKAGDPHAHVDLADAYLKRAVEAQDQRSSRQLVDALYTDAQIAAKRAIQLGATGWRANAVLAISALHFGDADEAHQRAEVAVNELPKEATSRTAMLVLALFAEARHHSIVRAVEGKKDWPGQWLTDMHAAHTLLARHPYGDAGQVKSHYDFLRWLGAFRQATGFLQLGLERFPDDWDLHARLRTQIMRRRGITALEPEYADLIRKKGSIKDPDPKPRKLEWFAGYASYIAAEGHRRQKAAERAKAAYDRSIAFFDESIVLDSSLKDSADHYVAVCLAGKARIAFEAQDVEAALAGVLASFARRSQSADFLDGLNLSAVDTAKMVMVRLKADRMTAQVESLEDAMKKLDPKQLELPAYERGGPPPQFRDPPPNRRRGRSGSELLRFDKNGDGKIQASELSPVLRERLLKRFDKNGDRVIDAQERGVRRETS